MLAGYLMGFNVQVRTGGIVKQAIGLGRAIDC